MAPPDHARRFVFRTRGVCPPEIHFKLVGDTVKDIRFVGGGCPGNARLVSRLLQGCPSGRSSTLLGGIACRNDTSCPDQLALAIEAVESGRLDPAESFRIADDPLERTRIGLIGSLDGDPGILDSALEPDSSRRNSTRFTASAT